MPAQRVWTPEQDAALREMGHLGNQGAANELKTRGLVDVDRTAVLRRRKTLGLEWTSFGGTPAGGDMRSRYHSTIKLPESPKPLYTEPLRLAGPSCVVLSDLHIPFHNGPFVENVLSIALAWGIQDVVINGDLIDVEAFSKWVGDPENTFEEELDLAEHLLNQMARSFQRVIFSLGNHEARFLGNATQRQIRAPRFLRMITSAANVEISSYEFTEMESPAGLWRFVHPKNASIISGRVPALIASRRWTDSHVVGAHGHLSGMVRTEDGKRWAIDSGCCLDIRRVAYVMKQVSTRPVMNNGAVIIYQGQPWLLTPESDWAALARLYAKEERA